MRRIAFPGLLIPTILICFVATAIADPPQIIPQPLSVQESPGSFAISSTTAIRIDPDSPDIREAGQYLADLLNRPLGAAIHPQTLDGTPPTGCILLTQKNADPTLGTEGYDLTITPDGIIIRAPASAGLFYGIQTLRQLLPPEVESTDKVAATAWSIPCVTIHDSPRFHWRGFMLDVSRHFFDKTQVEHFLDLMALYKLNVFHWHLTDDDGWRIQIKQYPDLTRIGAWRDGIGWDLDPKRSTHYDTQGHYGGFYTQDDIADVVAYAAHLHIMVVPEIEMPGHSWAAIRSYPQLLECSAVGPKTGHEGGVYDPGKEETFVFLENVLSEVIDLFPSPYIHIGGDEVPRGLWRASPECQARMKTLGLKNTGELQSYLTKRIEVFIESKHRHLIGWDEILDGGLAPDAAVMSWRGIDGGITAARAGHDVVMSPTSNAYFDYNQVNDLTLAQVYSFDPVPRALSPQQATHILGAQGNLWTEHVPDMRQAEYMALPRFCAMAELTWSDKSRMDWTDFQRRLEFTKDRLSAMGVNYFDGPVTGALSIGNWQPAQLSPKFANLDWNASPAITSAGNYRVTFQSSEGNDPFDIAWVALLQDGAEIARDTHAGTTGDVDDSNTYELAIGKLTPGAKYTLRAQIRSKSGTNSTGSVSMALDSHPPQPTP